MNRQPLEIERKRMVEVQLRARGIRDPRVLAAMERVRRHEFVGPDHASRAYEDSPLDIGEHQTISQPYIVGLMTEMLALEPDHRVLEVGTGSGYQTAVLAELAGEVFTIEVRPNLLAQAQERLEGLGYSNVRFRLGNGSGGWPEFAPYDRIIVTACAPWIPSDLVRQLRVAGRMVLPVGDAAEQVLETVTRREGGETDVEVGVPVRFVPLTGPPESP